jgi:hypothetical protein
MRARSSSAISWYRGIRGILAFIRAPAPVF